MGGALDRLSGYFQGKSGKREFALLAFGAWVLLSARYFTLDLDAAVAYSAAYNNVTMTVWAFIGAAFIGHHVFPRRNGAGPVHPSASPPGGEL